MVKSKCCFAEDPGLFQHLHRSLKPYVHNYIPKGFKASVLPQAPDLYMVHKHIQAKYTYIQYTKTNRKFLNKQSKAFLQGSIAVHRFKIL